MQTIQNAKKVSERILEYLKVKSRGLVFINGIWQRDRDSLVSKQNVENLKKKLHAKLYRLRNIYNQNQYT